MRRHKMAEERGKNWFYLHGEWMRKLVVTGPHFDGDGGGESTAGAVAHDGHPSGIDAEVVGLV